MPHFEEIEYKPIPARELFLEMKNLSELMIDLAYSAALFNDRELAEDVLELESRIDTLSYLLEMEIMIAARDPKDAEELIGVSVVASAVDKISDAAGDIAAIVLRDIGVHPIVTEIFEKVEERLMRAKVSEDSAIVGKQIGVLDLAAKMGVDIIAIHRNKDWIINPKEKEEIKKEDILIARGAQVGITEFKELVEGKRQDLEELRAETSRQRLKQFEKIVEQFVELKDTSELMIDLAYSSLLLNSKELAEEVHRLEAYMDNLHTDFELLVMSSKSEKGEARGFLGLIRLGVVTEKIADAAAEIAEVILRGIKPHPLLELTIEEAEETVTHVEVSEDSLLVNKSLRDARIPEETGMWVLAIKRKDKCIRPKPDTKIEVGDILIASGYAEGEEDLKKMASP
ncbi:MAG: TrkA C-terminal domain-containing protein [Candidatus Bathyarchaeia archaeon]